jgi:hypothetical protein
MTGADVLHPSCRDTNCTKAALIAGWCPGHAIERYRNRVKATKQPKARCAVTPTCSFDGCGRTAPVHELCQPHRRQLERKGTLSAIPERGQRPA